MSLFNKAQPGETNSAAAGTRLRLTEEESISVKVKAKSPGTRGARASGRIEPAKSSSFRYHTIRDISISTLGPGGARTRPPGSEVEELINLAKERSDPVLSVDLEDHTVLGPDGRGHRFEVVEYALLQGRHAPRHRSCRGVRRYAKQRTWLTF